ncbi:hypothetical protein EB796_001016 [Bugula neritina]|uniref:Uncharacterized protein n=1 Tax=Bugula neritina TaxID=10212 RepID=A0A7J7KRA7_BUGNE|nr:hypothetical protein EB796_001016 [Bugula neritina]
MELALPLQINLFTVAKPLMLSVSAYLYSELTQSKDISLSLASNHQHSEQILMLKTFSTTSLKIMLERHHLLNVLLSWET